MKMSKREKEKQKRVVRFWKVCWKRKAITLDMLHEAVEVDDITIADYEKITGFKYADFVSEEEEE